MGGILVSLNKSAIYVDRLPSLTSGAKVALDSAIKISAVIDKE